MKKKCCLSVVVALTLMLCVGCGKVENGSGESEKEIPTGIFYQITGIPADETVATMGDIEIPADLYWYWLSYACSNTEYQIQSYNSYYGIYDELINEDGTLKWDEVFYEDTTLNQYTLRQTNNTLHFYAAVEQMAEEYGVELTEEQNAAIAESLASTIASYDSEEAFWQEIHAIGLREESFNRVAEDNCLFEGLVEEILDENSELYLADEGYEEYAVYADHILLLTTDAETNEALSDEEKAERLRRAEELLAQLKAAEDKATLFAQLADENSEDTGRGTYPTGYIYTPGTMVTEFEDAAAALNPGEISEIVETSYGYHIIMRKDLAQGLADYPNEKQTLAEEHLYTLLDDICAQQELLTTEKLDAIHAGDFYNAYNSLMAEKEQATAGEDGDAAAETTVEGDQNG